MFTLRLHKIFSGLLLAAKETRSTTNSAFTMAYEAKFSREFVCLEWIRTLSIAVVHNTLFLGPQSSRTLKQLHYVTWPDHGVPDSIPSILEMLDEMRCYQAHDDAPICIHCRSGFFLYSA